MNPVDGIAVGVGLLAVFLLGVGLGQRLALDQLRRILDREDVSARDLPDALRLRLPVGTGKPSTGA